MKRFVILDRDGVINRDSPSYVKTEDEWIPEEGSLEAKAKHQYSLEDYGLDRAEVHNKLNYS